ncbi:MAG: mechanosensitive ion channel family protein [Ruminococcus sp.]|nr:mechanosensitive ion channel family protein [Ruminococcus sp.]
METKITEVITTEAAAGSTSVTETTQGTIQEKVSETADFFSAIINHIQEALPSLILALVIIIIGGLIVKLICRMVNKTMTKSNVDGAAKSFLVSFIRIILYMVVLITVLSVLNVPMSSIITILGAAGLAVSLALQNCLSNLCGGFIILFSKPFAAGDTIEIDNTVGKVMSINILYTKIETFDKKSVFIPNGKVSDAKIINYTETPERRLDLKFNISYNADFRKARELVLGIIKEHPLILKTPEPVVRMSSHNDSSVSIDVLIYVKNDDYFAERYNMIEAVKECFDENGIEIPYEQLDLHIKER